MSKAIENIDSQYYDKHENEVRSLDPESNQTIVFKISVKDLGRGAGVALSLNTESGSITTIEELKSSFSDLFVAYNEFKQIIDREACEEFLEENYVDMRRRGFIGYVIIDPEQEVFSIRKDV